MEPTSSFNWNLDVADFVPTAIPVKTEQKKKQKKREEEKKAVMPKETITVSFFGSQASGKSILANSLSGSQKVLQIDHGRLVNKDFKSRRYVIFDSNSNLEDQLALIPLSDYIVMVLKIDSVDEQHLRESAALLKNYVSTRVVVVLTHMDLVNWNDSIYFATLSSVRKVLDQSGLNDNIFVPVGRDQNIGQKLSKEVAPWYNGKSLILTLESLRAPQFKADKGVKSPLVQVTDHLNHPTPQNTAGTSFYIIRLVSGLLTPGSKLILMPSESKVDLLALFDSCGNRVDACKAGDVVKIQIRYNEERTRGLVLCENHEKCVTAKEFRAEVVFSNLPGGQANAGLECQIQIHNSVERAEVAEILSVFDLETKAKLKLHTARDNQRANIIVKTTNPICAENSSKGWDAFSKFALWSESRVVATGRVVELHNRVEEIASQMGLF